jgi:hypothetical protein
MFLVIPVMADAPLLWPDNTVDHTINDVSGSYGFDSVLTENQAIDKIAIITTTGQSTDFTLQMNNGDYHSGSVSSSTEYLGTYKTITYTLDGVTKTDSSLALLSEDGFYIAYCVVSNETTEEVSYYLSMTHSGLVGITQYLGGVVPVDFSTAVLLDAVLGVKPSEGILIELADPPSQNPMIRLNGNTPTGILSLSVRTTPIEDLAADESSAIMRGQNFINWGISKLGQLWDITMFLWGWIEFFFIDNLILTLLLVEGGLLAYHMNSAPNIFVAFERIIKTNTGILAFITKSVKELVELVGEVVSLVNPIRWLRG